MLGSLGPGARLASSDAAAAAAAAGGKTAFVKLGGGEYYELAVPWADLAGMNKNALLTALRKDALFGRKMKREAFPACRVAVLKGALPAGKDVPDATEEAPGNTVPLAGSVTVGAALESAGCAVDSEGPLFIRVTLPASSTPSSTVASSAAAADDYPIGGVNHKLMEFIRGAELVDIPGQPPGGCQLLRLRNKKGKSEDWPNLDTDTLLVRPVYREFYEREDLLNRFRPRAAPLGKRTLLHGDMGSGKTAFGLYCLWRAGVVDKRNVVYKYPAGVPGELVFENGNSTEETVSIGDNVTPFAGADVQLMLSSPPMQRGVEAFERHAETLFMPEPTEEEMRLMRDASFSDVSDTELKDRISRWGRAPRMVLTIGDGEEIEWSSVEAWATYRNPGTLPEQLLQAPLLAEMSCNVVHYGFGFDTAAPYSWPPPPGAPPRDYKKAYRRWASPVIEAAIQKLALPAEDHEQLKALAAAAPLELRRWERRWLHGFSISRIE